MRAVILAAGRGTRLGRGDDAPPKSLMRFGGVSLMRRHVELLSGCGIDDIAVAVGYRADAIEAELAAIGAPLSPRTVFNPRFERGSMVSLWTMRDLMADGESILLMDADVLYRRTLIDRLIATRHRNALLFDADFEAGDEPVKICLQGGEIVEFRKKVGGPYEAMGESVGFFRLSPDQARAIASRTDAYVSAGDLDAPYEEAIRDVILESLPGTFGIEEITGEPWIEIDFAEDIERAEREILPRL